MALICLLTSLSAAANYSFTIRVDVDDVVTLDIDGREPVLLKAGDNTYEVEDFTEIECSVQAPWLIKEVVKDDGTPEGTVMPSYGSYWSLYISEYNNGLFTITVANLSEVRTASCTVNVDDASRVRASMDGYWMDIDLETGTNTVNFDPENETTMFLNPSDWNHPLYQVKLNGEPVEMNEGCAQVPITDGCTIDITAIVPDIDVTLSFVYEDEESKDAIRGVFINEEKVTDFDGNSIKTKAGKNVSVETSSLYAIDSFSVNGVVQQYFFGAWQGIVMNDMTFSIKAHKYNTYKATVKYNDPEAIELYRGYSHGGELLTLSGNEMVVEVPENNPIISWAYKLGYKIDSVTVNGEAFEENFMEIQDGDVIEITTTKLNFDQTAAVWIDDIDKATYGFHVSSSVTYDDFAENFKSGYNTMSFSSDYSPFELGYYAEDPLVNKVYLNGKLIAPDYEDGSSYTLELTNEDVVKVFLASDPVECKVKFNVAEGADITAVHDLVAPVKDLTAELPCFAGTRIDMTPAEGALLVVKLNGDELDTNNGVYSFVVEDAENTVEVDLDYSGINAIGNENVPVKVFNMQGIFVGNSTDNLPAGLYIVAGKKVIVK